MSYNEELQSNNDALRGILDEVNALPDGTGGVQPDYLQNDPAARDFIKNRPFYDSRRWTRVVAEESSFPIGTTPMGNDYRQLAATAEFFEKYPTGTTARCTIDGNEYVAQIERLSYGGDAIGDYGEVVSSGDNGRVDWPFCIWASGSTLYISTIAKMAAETTVTVDVLEGELKKISDKFLPQGIGGGKPLILDANLADYYGGHSEAGDAVLEAIKTGRQILVRVPNASGDNYVASYSPVYFTQLPLDGQYLYLFYLRDEKQDLSALLGQPAGTVVMPTYGQLMMLLSQHYNSNPLEG